MRRHRDLEAERWLRVAVADGIDGAEDLLRRTLGEYAAEAVEVLRRQGADLSEPRRLEHYLYVPDEAAARRVAEEAAQDGYEAEVRPSGPAGSWLVLVSHELVIDEERFSAAHLRLGEIAHAAGGDYDGWETSTA